MNDLGRRVRRLISFRVIGIKRFFGGLRIIGKLTGHFAGDLRCVRPLRDPPRMSAGGNEHHASDD